MKHYKTLVMATLCLGLGVLIFSSNSSAGTQDKMPITTMSQKALDYYLQGRNLAEKLRLQEARQYFLKAVEEDPDFAIAHLQLAGVQPSQKQYYDSFNKAKALSEKVSKAEQLWIAAFEAGSIEGNTKKARNLFQELVNAYPNDERARNLLATNYFVQQEWESAIVEFEKAIAINPEFSPAYNQLGYAYRFQNQFDKAAKIFEKNIELIPDDPNPYDSYAELLMKMGKFDESIAQYKMALKVNPEFTFSHLGIASNLNFKGEYEAARKQLQQMYDNAKDDGQRRTALSAMAWSYIDGGNFDKAVELFEKQYAMSEEMADTNAMAGDLILIGFTVIEVNGREKEALELFQKATAMVQASSASEKVKKRDRHGANYSICRAYQAMGDLENARKYADRYREVALSVQSNSQIKSAHQLDGLIALKEGDYDKAIEELLQSSLNNPYNNYYLGKAYEAKGDIASAKKYYNEAGHCNSPNSGTQASVRTKALKQASAL